MNYSSIHIPYYETVKPLTVNAKRYLILAGVLGLSLAYFSLTNWGASIQVEPYEQLTIDTLHADHVDGHWVISAHVKNSGGWQASIAKIYVLDQATRLQIFDVTHINSQGHVQHIEELGSRDPIEAPKEEFLFIQFKIPEESITENELQIHLKSMGGMDYYKATTLETTSIVSSSDILRYDSFTRKILFEEMKPWIPVFATMFIGLGFVLDGYLKRKVFMVIR